MIKKIPALVLTLAVLCLCALSETNADLYSEIDMRDTLETLTERLGKPEIYGETYVFAGECACVFFESGMLKAKARVFENVRELAAYCENDLQAQTNEFTAGDTFEYVESELGVAGIEIIRVNLSVAQDAGARRVLAWRDKSDSAVEMLFEYDEGEWKLFYIISVSDNENGDANV